MVGSVDRRGRPDLGPAGRRHRQLDLHEARAFRVVEESEPVACFCRDPVLRDIRQRLSKRSPRCRPHQAEAVLETASAILGRCAELEVLPNEGGETLIVLHAELGVVHVVGGEAADVAHSHQRLELIGRAEAAQGQLAGPAVDRPLQGLHGVRPRRIGVEEHLELPAERLPQGGVQIADLEVVGQVGTEDPTPCVLAQRGEPAIDILHPRSPLHSKRCEATWSPPPIQDGCWREARGAPDRGVPVHAVAVAPRLGARPRRPRGLQLRWGRGPSAAVVRSLTTEVGPSGGVHPDDPREPLREQGAGFGRARVVHHVELPQAAQPVAQRQRQEPVDRTPRARSGAPG